MPEYRLQHQFTLSATGQRLQPPSTDPMALAARAYRTRNYAAAERHCLALIEQDSRHFDALHLQGVLCMDRGQSADAVDYLRRAARERPDDPQVNYHLGTALLDLKQHDEAERWLRHAVSLRPADVSTLVNLGNALAGGGRHDLAVDCYRRALAQNPRHVPAHFNLGRSLYALDLLEESVACFQQAQACAAEDVAIDRLADIHAELGQSLAALGRHAEAIAACRAIAHLRPAVADWNESLILLLQGRYAEGWRKYEGRWGVPSHDRLRADASLPALVELAGKRVLLIPEQGHGDMIQFARYAPLLAAHGADVTLQTYSELQALMQSLAGVGRVIALDEREPAADVVTPLLSLPLVFSTSLATIPAEVPYLQPPAARVAAWRKRLGVRTRPRVGVAWRGLQHIAKRSMPVETLLPLLSHVDVEFHALQQEILPAHRAWLAECELVIDHSAALRDFADTAALIGELDLVITIDTSVAHLAGALGRPVWIMLQHNADWRWLLHRNDSPWYPTARLFRQARRGDWQGVVADVVAALRAWAATTSPAAPARM